MPKKLRPYTKAWARDIIDKKCEKNPYFWKLCEFLGISERLLIEIICDKVDCGLWMRLRRAATALLEKGWCNLWYENGKFITVDDLKRYKQCKELFDFEGITREDG